MEYKNTGWHNHIFVHCQLIRSILGKLVETRKLACPLVDAPEKQMEYLKYGEQSKVKSAIILKISDGLHILKSRIFLKFTVNPCNV